MEKRIGAILIMIEKDAEVSNLNAIISAHSEIIIGRQGIPLRDKGINVISLVIESTTDKLGSLTGKLGKLRGVHIKSILMKNKQEQSDEL